MDKSPDAFRTISEVSDWLETPAHVLRFWESRFTQLKPVKRAGGRRYYRPGDMALLGGIKKLLHDDGMTIRGVQKILREQGVRYVATLAPATLASGVIAADLTLDEAEYGTPEVFSRWQEDRVSDGNPPPPAPEAPIHLDVPEAADESGEAEIYTLSRHAALAELSSEELAEIEFGPTEADDLDIPPELEQEWADILAEEATARAALASGPGAMAPAAPQDPVPQSDLFAGLASPAELLAAGTPELATAPEPEPEPDPAPTRRRRPARDLPSDDNTGGPLPVPLATLLRQMPPAEALTLQAELTAMLQRLQHSRRSRDAAAFPGQR